MGPLEYISDKILETFQLLHLGVTELGYSLGENLYKDYQVKVPKPEISYNCCRLD